MRHGGLEGGYSGYMKYLLLGILKDERPTSNIERPTSNNDVASLCAFGGIRLEDRSALSLRQNLLY